MYHYFISYHHGNHLTNGWGFGSVELHRDTEIKSWDDLTEIKKRIEEAVKEDAGEAVNVVIVNWRLF